MKELLYLKDEQIKDFIQLLFYAYRETFSDPKKVLAKKFFGPAHLRSLNLIERHPGISLGELMYKLKVTKQSLNRVLRDLIKTNMIKQIKDNPKISTSKALSGSMKNFINNNKEKSHPFYWAPFVIVGLNSNINLN